MQQNMSFGSNGVDQVRSLWKVPIRLHGTNFCNNCTTLSSFCTKFRATRNDPKSIQTLWNAPKHEFRVRWCGSGGFVAKILMWLCATNFCINCNSLACFEPSIIKQRSSPNCSQPLWNATKHEFWVQWGWSGAFIVKKVPIRLHGTLFCNNCTTLSSFCTEFHAVMKWSQMHPTSPLLY